MTRVSLGLGPLVSSGSEPSALVRTVLRLLSIADAEAVFLFASARSRSNIVSCATLATSGSFFELLQLTPPLRANDASGPTTVPERLSPASSGDPCDSPAPVDQRSCLNRSIVQNDADLNRTYQDLLAQARKSGGTDLEQRFRQSQRDWVNQRDIECRGSGDGALWARERARCLAGHSTSRAAELQRSLNSLRGQ